MKKSNGAILIISLLVIAILLSVGTAVVKMVFSESRIVKNYYYRKSAFYLSEAGIEEAKTILVNNPDWFTDMPHSPSDDITWLIYNAEGYYKELDDSGYKIIRENGKNTLYSIGAFIRSGKKQSTSIIKIEFQNNPFKTLNFTLL